MAPVRIELKPSRSPQDAAGLIPKEIFTRLDATGGREEEIQIPLPAVPGLSQIKEVVLTYEPGTLKRPIDLTITRVAVEPMVVSPAH
jgi:hypothetical protein